MEPMAILRDVWFALGIVWLIAAFRVKRTERSESSAHRLGYAALMIAAFLLLGFRRFRVGVLAWRFVPAGDATAETGLAMVIAGAAFAAWARLYLGSNWSGRITIKEDHELVRTGPYAIVRHPIYSGLLLAVLGTAVAIGELGCLLAFALAIAGWGQKWRTEEQFLRERFGAQYESYRKEVKGLIPFVV